MADYIGISKPLIVAGVTPKPEINYFYGPWESVEEALDNIPQPARTKGLTVGIIEGSEIVEYWFKNSVELVLKLVDPELVYTMDETQQIINGLENTYVQKETGKVLIPSTSLDKLNLLPTKEMNDDTYVVKEVGKRLIEDSKIYKLDALPSSVYSQAETQQAISTAIEEVDTNLQGQINTHESQIQDIVNAYIDNKGYFATYESLGASYPIPEIGDTAYVADASSSTGYYIYNVVDGVWTSSTVEAPPVAVAIGDYILKTNVKHDVGDSETDIMSQDAVTKELNLRVKFDSTQEFIYALLDADDKVVIGIRVDGTVFIPETLIPESVLNKLTLKVNVTDIVDSLLSTDNTKPLSAKQGNVIKLLIDSINTALGSVNNSISAINNNIFVTSTSEYIFAIIDSEEKVLFGIRDDGTQLEKPKADEDILIYKESVKDYVYLIKDIEDKIIFGVRYDNSLDFPALQNTINPLISEIAILKESLIDFPRNEFDEVDEFDESVGLKFPYGSAEVEKEATSLTSPSDILLDEYITKNSSLIKKTSKFGRMVAINHDDLPIYDYLTIRKLLNKYKFTSTFSYILYLFSSVQQKTLAVENIKKLIADGNEITFHAFMLDTSPYASPLYETKPNDKTNFVPSLAELQPIGETGINSLGYAVNSLTKFNALGFVYPAVDVTVMSATEQQYSTIIKKYVVWNNLTAMSGLDLDDNSVSKRGILGWLEYWYNNLIEDLGYSTYDGTTAERFLADYDFPIEEDAIEFYPDLSHVKSGKIIDYNDIVVSTKHTWYAWKNGSVVIYTLAANPVLNDKIYLETDLTEAAFLVASSDGSVLIDNQVEAVTYERFSHLDVINHIDADGYQAVGKFKTGLFKDCSTTMNSEIVDRLLMVVKAYMKHYFDYDELCGYTAHGGSRSNIMWKTGDWNYFDRELNLVQSEAARIYSTRLKTYRSLYDIMLSLGMKIMQNSVFHSNGYLEGQVFLYEGQRNIRNTNLYSAQMPNPVGLAYPQLYGDGTTRDYATSSLAEVQDVFDDVSNWGQFLIDNADKTVEGKSGATYLLSTNFREWVERTVATFETGKVPQFTFDTIKNSAGMKMILEMFYQFCYKNDIEVVGYNYARQIMINTPKPYMTNYFPNAGFRQTIKETYGTVSERSKLPDGFKFTTFDADLSTINVETESITIDEETIIDRVLSVFKARYFTKIYGLQPGKYKFSCLVQTDSNISIGVGLRKNSDFYDNANYTFTDTITVVPAAWQEINYEFEVNNPIVEHDNSNADVVCAGYHKNISNIHIEFNFLSAAANFKISKPRIITI